MTTHSARVIADSVSEAGKRITTVEATLPRIVLAELNTHRALSRNSASSRAIPVRKMIERVRRDPYIPDEWPANCRGMSPRDVIEAYDAPLARAEWMWALDGVLESVESLLDLGIHKEVVNRLLEPFLWHTVVITATEWDNFLNLRCAPDTSRPLRLTAIAIREALVASTPTPIPVGGWHLPFIRPEDRAECAPEDLIPISTARCARVSYLTHDGRRDHIADLDLYARLLNGGHMSPFEHPAQALPDPCRPSGNFRGWHQHRKSIPFEHDPLGAR